MDEKGEEDDGEGGYFGARVETVTNKQASQCSCQPRRLAWLVVRARSPTKGVDDTFVLLGIARVFFVCRRRCRIHDVVV